MTNQTVAFHPVDLRNALEHEYECMSEFKNTMNREYRPDDPPFPLEENVQGWKNIPQFVEYEAYILWNNAATRIIAQCDIAIYNTGDNEHMADFSIEILPEHRRKGIAREALRLLLPFATKRQRRLLLACSSDRIPNGGLFLERLGARKGLETHINQLKISELDRSLIQHWLENSEPRKNEFELGLWDGGYPDSYIDAIATLFQDVAKDAPRDTLDMEDMNFTPEIMRQMELGMFARGDLRRTMYLTDRANAKLAGLTEIIWNPNRKMIVNQGFTGVYPEYRNKGLGRWLKAEKMNKVLNEHPEVEFVRTTNANSNAPMLKINVEMGFKPFIANTIWQVETERVEKYLLEAKY